MSKPKLNDAIEAAANIFPGSRIVPVPTPEPKAKKKPKALKICNVANEPILPPEVMKEVQSAVAQFLGSDKWYDWGLKTYRKQGALVKMYGPPGTGKTLTAKYLTQIIKRPLSLLDIGTFGIAEPGGAERKIREFFADANEHGATIFFDEADSILWDREKAGGDSMWMISIINVLLQEMSEYRHLVIIATNRNDGLDPAVDSRVIANIYVGRPDYSTRVRLWQTKIPKKFPLQLSPVQMHTLAEYDLTGRGVENAVFKTAQLAILDQIEPTFEMLCNVAKTFIGK